MDEMPKTDLHFHDLQEQKKRGHTSSYKEFSSKSKKDMEDNNDLEDLLWLP